MRLRHFAQAALGGVSNRTIRSEVIYAAYAQNPLAADKLYKGQVYTIGGTVDKVASEDKVFVELVTNYISGSDVFGIRCVFSDPKGVDQLKKGNPTSIAGTIDGLQRGTVIVKDCHLPR